MIPALQTAIDGTPAPWDAGIWQLWYTHVDSGDPKLYDDPGLPVSANWMPPRGDSTTATFSFTLRNGRTFHRSFLWEGPQQVYGGRHVTDD